MTLAFDNLLICSVPLPYFRGRPTRYSDRLYISSITIPDIIGYLHQQFRTAKLWSSLPAECFPLTCVLDGFKPRVDRSLLSLGYF